MAMTIKVNSVDREVAEGANVLALLAEAKLKPQLVAVEVNRRLVRSEKYDQPLKAGDEVEIVTFVGGVRRSKNVGSPLKGCFPGGTVETGESQEQAVVREMQEELGLKVRPVKRVWKHEFPDKPLTLWGWIAEVENSSHLKVNEEELAEVLWMDPQQGCSHPDGLPTNRDFLFCLVQDID